MAWWAFSMACASVWSGISRTRSRVVFFPAIWFRYSASDAEADPLATRSFASGTYTYWWLSTSSTETPYAPVSNLNVNKDRAEPGGGLFLMVRILSRSGVDRSQLNLEEADGSCAVPL